MGLRCRYCNSKNTRVTCTRDYKNFLKKYKRCLDCNQTFRTIETYEQPKPGPEPGTPRTRNIRRGENHGTAVYSEADILKMRRLFSDGETLDSLAKMYGTSRSYVSRLVNRKFWTHI